MPASLLQQALQLAPPAASQPLTLTLSGEMVAGITVGATAGCILLFLCICALGCWCCRRQHAHEEVLNRLRADLRRMKLGKQRGCGRSSSSTSVHGLLSPSRTPSPTGSPRTEQSSEASPVSGPPALSKEQLAELERQRVAAAAAAAAAEREVLAREQHAIAKEEAALLAAEEAELAAEEAALEVDRGLRAGGAHRWRPSCGLALVWRCERLLALPLAPCGPRVTAPPGREPEASAWHPWDAHGFAGRSLTTALVTQLRSRRAVLYFRARSHAPAASMGLPTSALKVKRGHDPNQSLSLRCEPQQ